MNSIRIEIDADEAQIVLAALRKQRQALTDRRFEYVNLGVAEHHMKALEVEYEALRNTCIAIAKAFRGERGIEV